MQNQHSKRANCQSCDSKQDEKVSFSVQDPLEKALKKIIDTVSYVRPYGLGSRVDVRYQTKNRALIEFTNANPENLVNKVLMIELYQEQGSTKIIVSLPNTSRQALTISGMLQNNYNKTNR